MFALAPAMRKHRINFILIQIDEAHSSAWPLGLLNQVDPQKNIEERIERAQTFQKIDQPPFDVYVDTWENTFANTYKAWPDMYYCVDNSTLEIIGRSEYNSINGDAVIDKDCTVLIKEMMSLMKKDND